MHNLRATPPRASLATSFIPPDFDTCKFVLFHHDAQPYVGPYKVVRTSDKDFVIGCKGNSDTVSIDRVKPAYFEELETISTSHSAQPHTVTPLPSPTGV
ncbi:unnamed protein product [Dibothriocephalus latus]|uniref:Uncharacterized protein n=1 Tax=Dibothriocephalus latus TaxID=60516 RepID=A0A3P7P5H6_DIBLA|nr:unnamed protein product [Dibothriocephalus latus]